MIRRGSSITSLGTEMRPGAGCGATDIDRPRIIDSRAPELKYLVSHAPAKPALTNLWTVRPFGPLHVCRCGTRRNPTMQSASVKVAAIVMMAGILAAARGAWAADSTGGIAEQPLAPRPFRRGKTMFVQLSPEETGVRTENPYDDPRMWGELYQEFEAARSAPAWRSATMTATAGPTSSSSARPRAAGFSATSAATSSRT